LRHLREAGSQTLKWGWIMPYTQTIATFFKVLGPAGSSPEWQNVSVLLGLFVQDTPAVNPIYPNVGLTTGGPQFTGQNNIGVLFTHLFLLFSGRGACARKWAATH
jgi:hypothetical protein